MQFCESQDGHVLTRQLLSALLLSALAQAAQPCNPLLYMGIVVALSLSGWGLSVCVVVTKDF